MAIKLTKDEYRAAIILSMGLLGAGFMVGKLITEKENDIIIEQYEISIEELKEELANSNNGLSYWKDESEILLNKIYEQNEYIEGLENQIEVLKKEIIVPDSTMYNIDNLFVARYVEDGKLHIYLNGPDPYDYSSDNLDVLRDCYYLIENGDSYITYKDSLYNVMSLTDYMTEEDRKMITENDEISKDNVLKISNRITDNNKQKMYNIDDLFVAIDSEGDIYIYHKGEWPDNDLAAPSGPAYRTVVVKEGMGYIASLESLDELCPLVDYMTEEELEMITDDNKIPDNVIFKIFNRIENSHHADLGQIIYVNKLTNF